MPRLGRDRVHKLNRLREMTSLSRMHPDETSAGQAFVDLCQAAQNQGVLVMPIEGGPRVLDSGTHIYNHSLAMADQESIWDSILVRQVHVRQSGSTEVTAYFS